MKETINKTKRLSTEWEKVFANDVSDKDLIYKNRLRVWVREGGQEW